MSIAKETKKGPQPPKTLLELLRMMIKQVPKNLLRQIPWMIVVSGFTWVFHTYLLVYINEGFDVSGATRWTKAALSGNGSPSGILFWTLMAGVASLGFSQIRQNGLGKTFKAIGSAPGWVSGSFKGFSITKLPLLMGSLAVGLLVLSFANSPLYAIQLGLLLLGEWLALGKGLLGMVVPLGWSDMQRWFNRGVPPAPFGANWMAIILVGLSASALFGLVLPLWFLIVNLVGAIILTVFILATKMGKPTPRGTIMLLAMLLALGVMVMRLNGVVLADDGGWKEAGGTLKTYIASEGAGIALGFGFPPAMGAALGWLLGSTFAGLMEIPELVIPEISSVPGWVTDPEVAEAVKAWQKELDDANREAQEYQQQWDDVKGSYDVNDPNYQKLKDQYTQYINSQNQRADEAKNQIDQMLALEAQSQQEAKYKNAYDEGRKADAEFIDEQRQKLENRDTDFDRTMDQNVAERKNEAAQLDQLQKIRSEASDHGLGAGDGPGDAVKKSNELIDDILSGKDVDQNDIDKVAKVVKDRVSGSTKKEGEERLPSIIDDIAKTIVEEPRTFFTGLNSDGTPNYLAIGARIALAIPTAGASEWVFTPMNMGYNAKNAIDGGSTNLEALRRTLSTAAFEILMGKAIGAGIGAGFKAASKTAAVAGEVIEELLPGTSKAVGEGFKSAGNIAREGVEAFKDVFPGTSKMIGKAASSISSISNKISKAFQKAPVPKPIPTAHLDSMNRLMQKALKSGDEKAILNLYRNGGMKSLGKLEELGHITPEAASQLNKTLTKAANEAIDTGTEKAISEFQKTSGVKIKKVFMGDSGSSAKGGNRSVFTDNDRTLLPNYERNGPDGLLNYAKKNGITPAEAERRLNEQFCDTHMKSVNKAMENKGMPGGAKDMDYKTYNGIGKPPPNPIPSSGPGTGPTDYYPTNYTQQRQIFKGRTTVYTPKGEGIKPGKYQTSGEALVDADALAKGRMTGQMPATPGKVGPAEMPDVIRLQIKSGGHPDLKSVAKAFGRTKEAAGKININTPEMDELGKIAKSIADSPQGGEEILAAAKMTKAQFIERARIAMKDTGAAAPEAAAQVIEASQLRMDQIIERSFQQ